MISQLGEQELGAIVAMKEKRAIVKKAIRKVHHLQCLSLNLKLPSPLHSMPPLCVPDAE